MKLVFLARGLPGSGKSTLARGLLDSFATAGLDASLVSTDQQLVCRCCGAYRFSLDRLRVAHEACQHKYRSLVDTGADVVLVDNTNVTQRECRPYVEYADARGYKVVFLEPTTPWAFDVDALAARNTHGVPREAIAHMKDRWVHDMTVALALADPPPGPLTADEAAACGEGYDV